MTSDEIRALLIEPMRPLWAVMASQPGGWGDVVEDYHESGYHGFDLTVGGWCKLLVRIVSTPAGPDVMHGWYVHVGGVESWMKPERDDPRRRLAELVNDYCEASGIEYGPDELNPYLRPHLVARPPEPREESMINSEEDLRAKHLSHLVRELKAYRTYGGQDGPLWVVLAAEGLVAAPGSSGAAEDGGAAQGAPAGCGEQP